VLTYVDNNDELPRDENQLLVRNSTRKIKKSIKLLSALKAKEGSFLVCILLYSFNASI
jgi:hypothetical protein